MTQPRADSVRLGPTGECAGACRTPHAVVVGYAEQAEWPV